MHRWLRVSLLAAVLVALGLGAACSPSAAFRTRRYEAAPVVQAHDRLRADVVYGGADGLARRGGCAICRY